MKLATVRYLALALVLSVGEAGAQSGVGAASPERDARFDRLETRSNNLYSQLFGRSEEEPRPPGGVPTGPGAAGAPDLMMRLDRIENQMRQIVGALEQLQYRNQQLEQQLMRLQQDPGTGRLPSPRSQQPGPAMVPAPPPPGQPGRRGDAFDPTTQPDAPGVPRQLGGGPLRPSAPAPGAAVAATPEPNVPAPRQPGAPLDIGSPAQVGQDPSLGPRGPGPIGDQAVLAPSGSPKDEYDLAYGYLLRRDYALAEQAFRTYLSHHPGDRLVPDAHFWLGESLYQRQQYNESGEVFLDFYNKYPNSLKAPDGLLRLGQSLAALGKQDGACAAFGAIATKYPRASANVKQMVEREQRRARC
jgi:tol-pal system protein YbgF